MENLTGEINATHVEEIEKYLFFNTSELLARSEDFFYKSLEDGMEVDLMTKLRKQTHL